MNPENMVRVKGARHKRSHIVGFHLYKMSRTGKSVGTESTPVTARGWGRGWGVSADGHKVTV